MIRKIVNIIRTYGDTSTDNRYISISSMYVDAKLEPCIIYLQNNSCLETFVDDQELIGTNFSNSIIWDNLKTINIYKTKEEFVESCQNADLTEFYIYELDCFNDSDDKFVSAYNYLLALKCNLKNIADHIFDDSDCEYIILSFNEKTVVLDFEYDVKSIEYLEDREGVINDIISILKEQNEKRRILINELVEFVQTLHVNRKFTSILHSIDTLYNRTINSYDFYLSNYSTNKLRLEIDSKALDYSQRIQTSISDAQTRLVAIPTAFLLAATSMDFKQINIISTKNIIILISIYIFAILMQIFINNQRSVLRFIECNIREYKELFKTNSSLVSRRFNIVDKSLRKQFNRINLVICILWAMPILLSLLILIINYNNYICIILKILLSKICLCTILAINIIMKL